MNPTRVSIVTLVALLASLGLACSAADATPQGASGAGAPAGTTELCNGVDDDGNGTADDGARCPLVGYVCRDGVCACPAENFCGDACADLDTDPFHCGACGNDCAIGEVCHLGSCTIVTGGVGDVVDVASLFGIDATEVTRAQYEGWLSTQPPASAQPIECAWNDSYGPNAWCMNTFATSICAGAGCGGHPQVCVDWCDATAYCRSVGKHLCGRIGGGANALQDYADASRSEWYSACSSGGRHAYPYGDDYDPLACNGWDREVKSTSCAGSMSKCQSTEPGYEGVLDLSGNVWEWEDSCDDTTGEDDFCLVRGGAFASEGSMLPCRDPYTYYRGFVAPYVGFRCCADR